MKTYKLGSGNKNLDKAINNLEKSKRDLLQQSKELKRKHEKEHAAFCSKIQKLSAKYWSEVERVCIKAGLANEESGIHWDSVKQVLTIENLMDDLFEGDPARIAELISKELGSEGLVSIMEVSSGSSLSEILEGIKGIKAKAILKQSERNKKNMAEA
jgi:hypothetical protein